MVLPFAGQYTKQLLTRLLRLRIQFLELFFVLQQLFRAHTRAVTCLLLLNEQVLVSGGGDARVIFWDLVSGRSSRTEREDWPVWLAQQSAASCDPTPAWA